MTVIDNETMMVPLALKPKEQRRLVGISEMPPFVVAPTDAQRVLRRTIDLTIAIVALLVFAIPMLVIALAVKLTSPGNAFFTQDRAGAGGQNFKIFKFRSMTAGTSVALESDPDELQAFIDNDFKLSGEDARITPVGKFLRRTSLDELPQLINVVLGDMSIVGIRPLFPEQLEQRSAYDRDLYGYMRPGLTGRWQVAGRSNIRDEERIMLDREYVESWSIVNDLRLMVQTPRALLMPGAAR